MLTQGLSIKDFTDILFRIIWYNNINLQQDIGDIISYKPFIAESHPDSMIILDVKKITILWMKNFIQKKERFVKSFVSQYCNLYLYSMLMYFYVLICIQV